MNGEDNPFVDALLRIVAAHPTSTTAENAVADPLWDALSESGLALALVGESAGGGELSWTDAWPLFAQLGRAAVAAPLADAMLGQWLLWKSGLDLADGLPVVAMSAISGDLTLSEDANGNWVANGSLTRVMWARRADAIVTLATHGGQTYTVVVAGGALQAAPQYVSFGQNVAGEPCDDIRLEAVQVRCAPAPLSGASLQALAASMRAVQMAGALEACLALAVDYSKLRQQFGRTLAAFQAIQQQLARLATQTAVSLAASQAAFEAIDTCQVIGQEHDLDLAQTIYPAVAKIRVGEAAGIGSAIAHQVFGAIGFTREHELHRFTTRLWAWRDEFGNEAHWSFLLGQQVCASTETVWEAVTSQDRPGPPANSGQSGLLYMPRPHEREVLRELREKVRAFLTRNLRHQSYSFFGEFDADFSEALGSQGWIGMAFPRAYGGGERSILERHVVLEELLAARAPIYAHSVADRQSGLLLLRYGQEWQRREILPRIAAGTCYFCIGMSEPGSGSDLASVRTRAEKVDGGYRVSGSKIWTSSAHRSHYMILLCRTGPAGQSRHEGLTQLLVNMSTPGVTCRPITNMAGEVDFNEVFLDNVFIGDEMLIGKEGDAWAQVTSELSFERSGPERFLSAHGLLEELATWLRTKGQHGADGRKEVEGLGRLVAHLAVLRRMSRSIATLLEQGVEPVLQACIVKDLGTEYEQEVPELMRLIVGIEPDSTSNQRLSAALADVMLRAPSFTLRGGTTEVLRGVIARGIGVR